MSGKIWVHLDINISKNPVKLWNLHYYKIISYALSVHHVDAQNLSYWEIWHITLSLFQIFVTSVQYYVVTQAILSVFLSESDKEKLHNIKNSGLYPSLLRGLKLHQVFFYLFLSVRL